MTSTNTFPPLPGRPLGISVGQLLDVAIPEIQKVLKECRGSQRKAAKVGLKRLHATNLLSDRDLKRLEKAYDLVFMVEAGKQTKEDVSSALSSIHAETLLDAEAAPLGITMIGVIYSRQQDKFIAGAAIIGGIVGAMIGFVVSGGNPEAAGLGFAIGLVVGAVVGAVCSEE